MVVDWMSDAISWNRFCVPLANVSIAGPVLIWSVLVIAANSAWAAAVCAVMSSSGGAVPCKAATRSVLACLVNASSSCVAFLSCASSWLRCFSRLNTLGAARSTASVDSSTVSVNSSTAAVVATA